MNVGEPVSVKIGGVELVDSVDSITVTADEGQSNASAGVPALEDMARSSTKSTARLSKMFIEMGGEFSLGASMLRALHDALAPLRRERNAAKRRRRAMRADGRQAGFM